MKVEQKKTFRIVEGVDGKPPEPEASANEWLAGKKGKVDVTRAVIRTAETGEELDIYYRMRVA